MPKLLTLILVSFFSISLIAQTNLIDLSGEWQVNLDTENEWITKNPTNCKTSGTIKLPGSLAENGFGYQTTGSDFGILTPEFKYIGKAWYKKEIKIPENWKDKEIEIFLERVLWESRVFIDGEERSIQDALGTPHIHKLGKIVPGIHELSIQVDNEMIHNIGDKGHAYGEYTQSIWNGIVGRIEMQAKDAVHFLSTQVYSNIKNETITLKSVLQSELITQANISYEISELNSGKIILKGNSSEEIKSGETAFDITIPIKGKLKKWSEFNPEVYVLKMKLSTRNSTDFFETEFGFYEISHNGTKLLINDIPVFLRGNLDCVHFPQTGYVSCDLEDWIKIFETYKDYGLNHARFHSWCPPEAAFKAANRVGIYLQAEASIWIDWWMSADMIAQGRPEMDTKGHPKGLGFDEKRDQFVIAEMNRMVDFYGNNPSFSMFCIGNELGNSDFLVMKKWIADLKKKDPRRLYSVSTAREITDVDDYCATHYIKDLGRTRGLNGAKTNWNFEETYSKSNIPIIAHEIGQWPVYPRWSEIAKYTGVLKARNLEEFKLQAEKNGVADQANQFADASGALNQIMYKYEIESFLRTESCAGIQLLSMQDYQGQGEALIGWLDSHWESKNITTPEKFKQHFNTTVPLLLIDKYVWENNEIFTAKVQVSHHAEKDLTAKVVWTILDENKKEFAKGSFDPILFKNGFLTDIGEIKLNLENVTEAKKLNILVDISDTPFKNEWSIWVYPKILPTNITDDIIFADKLDTETIEKLKSGAKVLLQANKLGTDETSVKALFYPLYWSLTFFPGQGKTNIGLLLNEKDPAFNNFPTSFHSNWQWETISSDAKGFLLNDLPHNYKPLAQPVDDFHRNNKVGSIFELKVGQGKLLVCGYRLDPEKPVAKQLKQSLLEYMNSDVFAPKQTVDENWLKATFAVLKNAETANLPKEFSNAILIVDAAAKLQTENENIPWNPELDNIEIAKEVSYQLTVDGVWKDNHGSAWHGKEILLQIDCPEGMLGTLLVHFTDYNNNNRSGLLDFEGRKSKLEVHRGEGFWVEFHVMREDSNDGKLILKTIAETGPNLMITKIILLKE